MSKRTCKLSVNINKIALLRNSRGKNKPDVLQTALEIVSRGAHGITVHPRPDGRHIRHQDVLALRAALSVELNVEGYPSEDFLNLVSEAKPAQVTLVPDPPGALTSNAGWRVSESSAQLEPALLGLAKVGCRSSVFIDPSAIQKDELQRLRDMGCDRIELYTEAYADAFLKGEEAVAVVKYKKVAAEAESIGLGVNAGHDLDQKNLRFFLSQVPEVQEVSIGHALVCEALWEGLGVTLDRYLRLVER